VVSFINLVTLVCVNVLVTLNTAPNSVTKGDRVVRNVALLLGNCLLACFLVNLFYKVARFSVDGIATRYGLGGRVIESRWRRDFCTRSDRPWAHQIFCTMGTGSFPVVKQPGGIMDLFPHLAKRVKKE
jgi:hypothetical protein